MWWLGNIGNGLLRYLNVTGLTTGVKSTVIGWCRDAYFGYDRWVQDTSQSMTDRTGVNLNPSLIKTVHLSIMGAGMYWSVSSTLRRIEENRLYSKFTTTVVPFVVEDLYVEPEKVFCAPAVHLRYSTAKVMWMSSGKDGQTRLVGMKTVFRAPHEEDSLPKLPDLPDYHVQHSRYSNDQIRFFAAGLIKDPDYEIHLPDDVTMLISRCLPPTDFEDLDPGTRLFYLPPIKEWHWREWEAYQMTLSLLENPIIKGTVGSKLDLDTRKEIFNLLLDYRSYIARDFANKKYDFGVKMKPSGYLGRRLLKTLTKNLNWKELADIKSRIEESVTRIEESVTDNQINPSRFGLDADSFFQRLVEDEGIYEYLDAKEAWEFKLERTILPYITNEVLLLMKQGGFWTYQQYFMERVLSKFHKKTLVIVTSNPEDEWFICRRPIKLSGQEETVRFNGNNLKRYFYKEYSDHPDNQEKVELHGALHTSGNPYGFMDDRLSFDMDAYSQQGVVKIKVSEERELRLESHISFLAHGTHFFDWLSRFDSSLFNSRWTLNASAELPVRFLYETASLWNFNISQYLPRDNYRYIKYFSKKYRVETEDDQLMNDCRDSMLRILSLDDWDWSRFCFKNIDIETAQRIVLNTDPNVRTLLKASQEFIQTYDKDHTALKMYDPDPKASRFLSHWADHGLCHFKWHQSHFMDVMTKNHRHLKSNDMPPAEFPRKNFLNCLMEQNLTKDAQLYLKVYAFRALRDNVLGQLLQMKISEGITVDISQPTGTLNIYLSTVAEHSKYSSLVYWRNRFIHGEDENLDENTGSITDHVENMLRAQGSVIAEYGTSPYTYWPGSAESDDEDSNIVADIRPHYTSTHDGLLEYKLPDSTSQSYSWPDYNLEAISID